MDYDDYSFGDEEAEPVAKEEDEDYVNDNIEYDDYSFGDEEAEPEPEREPFVFGDPDLDLSADNLDHVFSDEEEECADEPEEDYDQGDCYYDDFEFESTNVFTNNKRRADPIEVALITGELIRKNMEVQKKTFEQLQEEKAKKAINEKYRRNVAMLERMNLIQDNDACSLYPSSMHQSGGYVRGIPRPFNNFGDIEERYIHRPARKEMFKHMIGTMVPGPVQLAREMRIPTQKKISIFERVDVEACELLVRNKRFIKA